MNRNKRLTILACALALVAFGTFSLASQAGEKISLLATKKHPNASGTAVINNTTIEIVAKGLKPESVYTVWFVNTKPQKHETGAGQPPYMFRTDSDGNGMYTAPLDASPYGQWEMLMIVLHPNGDPRDMKNMVGALSANLR
ncbi:MAG: hypothetical protein JSW26_25465 [Desulfobacterales bacterium]|nr:MAG: hypothetical protein JSW26_25465 [Desulfobacterales bacterium]